MSGGFSICIFFKEETRNYSKPAYSDFNILKQAKNIRMIFGYECLYSHNLNKNNQVFIVFYKFLRCIDIQK